MGARELQDSDSYPQPLFSSTTALRWATVLLVGALGLDIFLATTWTEPFRKPSTWTLVGVLAGMGLRAAGRWRARQGQLGAATLKRLGVVLWGCALVVGILGWILQ